MIQNKIKSIYDFTPDEKTLEKLKIWHKLFLEYNSHTNLMSKNDLNVIFDKHVLDSLSLVLLSEFKNGIKLVDVGSGGGFPSLILAIFFPEINIAAIDSTRKKTNFIELVKNELELSNLDVLCGRVENLPLQNADILTNRAVGKIADVWSFSKKHLKSGGLFVSFKALTAEDEAKTAKEKYRELVDLKFVSYNLPLVENYVRKLVIFKLKSK